METNLAYKLDAYEDTRPTELIDGKVIAMSSPTIAHSTVVENIHDIFRSYLKGRRCRTFSDHVDVYLTKKDRYVPDVTVVCDPDKVKENGIYGAPDLVVEVLSPSTARNDKKRKKNVYERCGVREYWIVDPFALSVEQYVLEESPEGQRQFVLRDVYMVYRDYMLETMTDTERAEMITEFPCAIFGDLTIRLEDVFERVIK